MIAEEHDKTMNQHAIYIADGDFISGPIYSGGRMIVGGDMINKADMVPYSVITDTHFSDRSNVNMAQLEVTMDDLAVEQIEEGAWKVNLIKCTVAFIGVDGLEEAKRFVAYKLGISDSAGMFSVVLVAIGKNKVQAIKTVREFVPVHGLKDAKELVERVQAGKLEILGTWNRKEAQRIQIRFEDINCVASLEELPVVLPVPTPVPDTESEQALFGGPSDIILDSVPRQHKIQAIKIIREGVGLGLKDAKDLVDSAPCLIETTDDVANSTLKIRLENIGCHVTAKGRSI